MEYIITNRGFVINKNTLEPYLRSKIIIDLSIITETLTEKYVNILYTSTEKYIIVPIYYGINVLLKTCEKLYYKQLRDITLAKIGKKNQIISPNYEQKQTYQKIAMEFNGQLRDYQREIISKILTKYMNETVGGCILSIPCGFGKTTIALKMATEINEKTLIIVNTKVLLNQWCKRIEQYIPNAKIGYLWGKKCDYKDKDIVIGMLQSIIKPNKFKQSIFSKFGLAIFDECHHLPAKTYIKALQKIQSRYKLGLSATIKRSDGMEKMATMFIGEVFEYESKTFKREANVVIYEYRYTKDDEYKIIGSLRNSTKIDDMIKRQIIISNITLNEIRNEKICKTILEVYEDIERNILILSNRIEQLKWIKKKLLEMNQDLENDIVLYTGKSSIAEKERASYSRIILGSYQIAGEGLDIPTLNSMILASPTQKSIKQITGRIMRGLNQQPLIIDFMDMIDEMQMYNSNRKKYYNSQDFNIVKA